MTGILTNVLENLVFDTCFDGTELVKHDGMYSAASFLASSILVTLPQRAYAAYYLPFGV